jgi:hypothetical protein
MLKVDKFNVRIVRKGDRYGMNDMFTHNENRPLVEFYDDRFHPQPGDRGQFVSRYYAFVLLEYTGREMNLQVGVDAWYLFADDLNLVREYVQTNLQTVA